MGNAFINLLRDKDFKCATATIDGNRVCVKWNKLKKVRQYRVEVWCNQARGKTELVSKAYYSIPIEPGRSFYFKIKPHVHNGREVEDKRCVVSNFVYTTPSKVTGVCITELNGLKVEWRKPEGEDSKFSISVRDKLNHTIDEVNVALASYEWKYKKLHLGEMYIFEITSLNDDAGKSDATTETCQYEGRLDVECWIYLNEDCVCVFHVVTGDGVCISKETRNLEKDGYKLWNQKLVTYSLTRADFEASTTINSEAKITPHERTITHSKLWSAGWCTEEYLLDGQKGRSYTSTYTIRCQEKNIVLIPFRWTCPEQPRSVATQDPANPQQKSEDPDIIKDTPREPQTHNPHVVIQNMHVNRDAQLAGVAGHVENRDLQSSNDSKRVTVSNDVQ